MQESSDLPDRPRLQWDEHNLEHATRHGVSRQELDDMTSLGLWVMVQDTGRRRRRRARRRMIGQTSSRRFVTLIAEPTDGPNLYRPVSSWSATPAEIALYWARKRR